MPSILFINRVYPPMPGATGDFLAELAEELARRNWDVTVVTSGRDEPGESSNRVRVRRCGGLAFTRASHFRRALSYLSLYPVFFWNALRAPKADVIVTLTDPPLHLLLGPFLKICKRSKLMHWAQDVYPEIAEELGVIRRGGMRARILRGLSTWALRRCDRIVAVGECMKRRLIGRGIAAAKIVVIPNWSLKEVTAGGGEAIRRFREQQGFGTHFVVMYSGNLGLAHQFDAMIDAAAKLQSGDSSILFVFVGEGSKLDWLRERTRGFANVRFLPFQPIGQLSASLGSAELHLVSMRSELEGLVIPSKAYGILAAGRPLVFLGPRRSEIGEMVRRHDCGEVLENPDGTQLAESILRWKSEPGRLTAAGRNSETAAREMTVASAALAFEAAAELGT